MPRSSLYLGTQQSRVGAAFSDARSRGTNGLFTMGLFFSSYLALAPWRLGECEATQDAAVTGGQKRCSQSVYGCRLAGQVVRLALQRRMLFLQDSEAVKGGGLADCASVQSRPCAFRVASRRYACHPRCSRKAWVQLQIRARLYRGGGVVTRRWGTPGRAGVSELEPEREREREGLLPGTGFRISRAHGIGQQRRSLLARWRARSDQRSAQRQGRFPFS